MADHFDKSSEAQLAADGEQIFAWMKDLFPICRSITGEGLRKTLRYFQEMIPELKVHSVASGTKAFDWTVPDEWNIRDAYIADSSGNRIVDFKKCNLHVVGYSLPIDREMTFAELESNLHWIDDDADTTDSADAVPYVTSYYQERWGFCVSRRQMEFLRSDTKQKYRVKIDSDLKPGELNYGELLIPGREPDEVLFSTYVCHPSMANNELSGPCLATGLAKKILERDGDHRLSYRFLFVPETIGSIVYLSRHYREMQERIVAGFVLSCLGDERTYSHMSSRNGNTFADRIALHVLKHHANQFESYSFLNRGSDERQYCSPGIDLPVCGLSRSLYGRYPEYHTSMDNLDMVSRNGLGSSLQMLMRCVDAMEANASYMTQTLCEPQLGRRGIRPTLSTPDVLHYVRNVSNIIAYSDGVHDLLGIAELAEVPIWELFPLASQLVESGVLREINNSKSAATVKTFVNSDSSKKVDSNLPLSSVGHSTAKAS